MRRRRAAGGGGTRRGWARAVVSVTCAAMLLQAAHPLVFAGTTYQEQSDPAPIANRSLFDSVGSGVWPASSDLARDSGSRYLPYTRGLTGFLAGPGYAYGKGSTSFGWTYELPNSGGFGGCGPTQPTNATTPIGGGQIRVVGEGEKHGFGGVNNSIVMKVSFKNHECGAAQAILSETNISTWPHSTSQRYRHTFDVTVSIPAGARQIRFTVASPQGSLRLFSTRIYAAGPGQLIQIPNEQLFGLARSGHSNVPVRFEAEPVNTALGNYVTSATDLALPGRGLGFAFVRTYNSLDSGSGALGLGWRHAYESRLVLNPDGSARFHAEDGAQMLFTSNGQGGFTKPPGVLSRLAPIAGGYELTRRDQVRYRFDSTGWLTAMLDRNGNQLSLTYANGKLSQISDTVGRVISLSYDVNGRLETLAGSPTRTVTYGYDAAGWLSSVTDARGKVTNYTYDAGGRLATIVDPNLHTLVTNEYGANGRITAQTDGRGKRSTFAWDATTQTSTYTDANGGTWRDVYTGNVLQRTVNPLGNTTRYGYDANLNVTSITDPRNFITRFTYDASGNLLTRRAPAPLSYLETWTYTALNDVASYRDGRNNLTTYAYDPAGNLITITAPLSAITQFGRDPAGTGLLVSTTDPRSKTTTFGYDAESNLNRVTSPLGNVTSMTYDPAGRLLSVVDPRGNVVGGDPGQFTTSYTYDAADHLLTVTDPLGNLTSQAYDDAGNLSSVTDANHTISYGYDAANHLTTVTAAAATTTYGYDDVANLVSRTDANQHTTTYVYDLANQLVTTTDPASHSWVLTYDSAGNLATRRDANLQTTTYAYDALNRPISITYADPSTPAVTLGYDANSNRTSMTDSAGTESYGFDALNRLTTVTRGSDIFSYDYDPASNLTSRTYPGQAVQTWTFDDDGRLTNANGATYTYDPAANLLTAATPDGLTGRYTYDRSGRLLEVAHTTASDTLSRFSYALDAVGNRTAMTTREGTVTYRYDTLDRLTEACWSQSSCPGGAPAIPLPCLACIGGLVSRPAASISPPPGESYRTYTYDPVGNRLTETSDAGTTTYGYDVADRLTSTTPPGQGAISYTFDANGNQTGAGATTYTYDLADRLKTATVGATTETYSYASDGTRLSAATGAGANQTTKFLWDRAFGLPQLAIERDGNDALLRSYSYGLDLLSQTAGSNAYLYHHDGLGAVVDVTSSAGASLGWSEYYPYGPVRQAGAGAGAPAVQPFAFAGEQLDAVTGLYYLRARQYDPGTGRFLTTDPVSLPIDDPYVASYVYAGNNPTRYTDPSGKCLVVCAAFGAVGGAVVGAISYGASNLASGEDWDWGEFGGTVGGYAAGGAIIGFTGGAAAAIGGAAALAGTPAYVTTATQAAVIGNGIALAWTAETIGTGLARGGLTKQELGESLALAVYGGVFDRLTFDFASDLVQITVNLQLASLNGASSK